MSEADSSQRWRWPRYRDSLIRGADGGWPVPVDQPSLRGLAAAALIEWRYFAVLSPAFHGLVGLALVNPEQRFAAVAEGGLLVIVAGVLGRAPMPDGPSDASPALVPSDLGPADRVSADRVSENRVSENRVATGQAELCWMHLFSPDACLFDRPAPGALVAEDPRCRLSLRQSDAAQAELRLETANGLQLDLMHQGVSDTRLAPVLGSDLDAPLGRLLGSHWLVDCPSPVARCDGAIAFGGDSLTGLATAAGGDADSYATPALRARVSAGEQVFRWQAADGYAEHSFGVRPLPLHGWDFLFVPKAATGEAVVLQTYRGSRQLRYLEVCWRQDGVTRHHRFEANRVRLDWSERTFDPVLGVWRPLRRTIEARDAGLQVHVENRVLHRIPLLRRHQLAVRHFFISEEIGVADWWLEDAHGRCLAEVRGQPCGGELAHFRLRAPRRSV